MEHVKYFSLFSGIGGFELGLERAVGSQRPNPQPKQAELEVQQRRKRATVEEKRSLLPSNKRRERTVHCVGFSEIDKYAVQIYQQHFPDHKNYGDITAIDAAALPDFDLLVGGFPCQAFSIAGKRRGFEDIRGTLFFEIARLAREKQPRLLLLENVKGLLSHDEGRTFHTILCTLDELGYDLQWQVLNSKNFGVPQNRERVFIVGHLRGTPRPEVLPFSSDDEEDTRVVGENVSYALDANYHKGANTLEDGRRQLVELSPPGTADAQRVYDSNGLGRTLKGESGGQGGKMGLYKVGTRIRRLTPVECERLQGFPDGWTEGVSDTQRYKCLGNAVTVNVIEAVAARLHPPLSQSWETGAMRR